MTNPTTLIIRSICLILIAGLVLTGCSKSSSPTSTTHKVTNVVANGSFAPTSRTQVGGTLVVADQSGQPITGLSSSNITTILKWVGGAVDSVTGTINIQTASASGKNVAVAMTMDYSGSMFSGAYNSTKGQYQRILDMESGVKTFISAMRTGDKAEVIKFDDVVMVLQAMTTNKTLLSHAVVTLSDIFGGSTALYQSIYQGLGDAGAQTSTTYARAVIAFTDGGENASSVSEPVMLARSYALSVPVFTIGLIDSAYHSVPPGLYSYSEQDLVQIADSTGGFYFYAPSAADLGNIYNTISGQLSNAYVVTITFPSAGLPASGTSVTLTITIKYNNLTAVITRTYIMP
jgi:Ca-activated chloride channel homolog